MQVKLHPQLVPSVIGVLGLIVQGLEVVQPLGDLKDLLHFEDGVVQTNNKGRFVHKVHADVVNDLSFLVI